MRLRYSKRPYCHNNDIKIPTEKEMKFYKMNDEQRNRHRILAIEFLVPKFIHWIFNIKHRRRHKEFVKRMKEKGWID